MPKTETPEMLLRKHLGQESADAILKKIDKMVVEGASAEKIETAFLKDLTRSIEKSMQYAVAVQTSSMEKVTVKPIKVEINSTVGVIQASTLRISSVKIQTSPKIQPKIQTSPV